MHRDTKSNGLLMSSVETHPKLAIGPVGADFNFQRDIPLGPWCFVGAEDRYPEWTSLKFSGPFDNRKENAAACNHTISLAAEKAVDIGTQLNAKLGKDFGPYFWRLILIPWLTGLIQSSFYRYLCIERFVAAHKSEIFEVDIWSTDVRWNFKDYYDFYFEGIFNPNFDFWMSGLILDELKPDSWIVSYRDSNQPIFANRNHFATLSETQKKSALFKVKQAVRHLLPRLSFDDVNGIRFSKFLFSLAIWLMPRRASGTGYRLPVEKHPPGYFDDTFLRILDKLITNTMPLAYDRDFENFARKARSMRYKPARLLVRTLDNNNEAQKFLIAHAVDKGERLVAIQHGGFYGCGDTAVFSGVEFANHAFITWGWSEQAQYKGRFVALPSPFICKFAGKHRFKKRRLIMVTSKSTLFLARLSSIPYPHEWVSWRENKVKFLGNLNAEVMDCTFYRPYSRAVSDLEDIKYLQPRVGDLKIFKGDLHKEILGCRLLVLDHPGTTMNIAFAANVPLIGVWDKEVWPICEQARPYFDMLEKQNMLFRDGETAARYVNAIWPNVESWWRDEERQAARRAWRQAFSKTDKAWWREWLRALWRLSAEPG